MGKKTNIIIGLIIAVFTAVSIFVLFGNSFTDGEYATDAGSLFNVMFGSTAKGYKAVPLLIVAFSLYCTAFLAAVVGAFCVGKVQGIVYIVTLLMLVAGGVLILMSQSLFRAINPTSSPAPEKIDASPIVSSVFAFLGAALGLFGAYKAIKD